MPKVKSYMNPNIPRPTPSPSGEKPPRYKPLPVKPPVRKPKPKPGKGDDRKTIMPVPPKREKRPLPKPINKPGVKPSGRKTGPRRSNRNDIIRNRLRPVGTK